MREERFVAARRERWAELRALVERAQLRGLRSLSGAEARRLGALYRGATTDLAAAKSFRFSEPTVLHVNRLCVAAHGLVYTGAVRRGLAARGAEMLASEFPRVVRRTWRFHAAAAAAVLLPGVAAFVAMSGDPDLAERTLGTVFQERAERVAAMSGGQQRYFEIPDLWMPVFSWGLMANNVRVAMIGFALGCAGAVLAVGLLAVQGVNVGGGLAVFHDAGVGGVLWTWMAAHGPLELTAIFISCGAGMRVGTSVAVPGRRSRAAAFRETAGEAVPLLLGSASMLVCAGLLEGFVSPSDAPAPVKWGVGAATVLAMLWYFLRAGGPRGTPADPA